jgi:polyisoprenoid-binding protein YceI
MRIFRFAVIGLLLLSGSPGFSETLDLAKSAVTVEFLAVGQPSAIKIRGKLKDTATVTGTLNVRPDSVTGEATLPLDALDTGMELRNRHMKEKYLETRTYPTAELKGIKLALPASAGMVPFTGELSLHGKTKSISGLATVARPQLGLSFEFKISTRDFAIDTPQFMGVTVTEEVQISVKVEPGSTGAAG